MPRTSEAQQELLSECRSYYSRNKIQLAKIDEFERNYSVINTVRWYKQV
jgi:hypothetical protein